MLDVELSIFITLKTTLLSLIFAYLAISIIGIFIRIFLKNPFPSGRFFKIVRFNALFIMIYLLAVFICLFLVTIVIYQLSVFAQGVTDDGSEMNKKLNDDKFYYGFDDLRQEFKKLQSLSQTENNLLEKFSQNINFFRTAKNSFRSVKKIRNIDFSQKKQQASQVSTSSFLNKNWVKIENYFTEFLKESFSFLGDDKILCEKALSRIDYMEIRYEGTVLKVRSKIVNVFIVLLILLPLIAIGIYFFLKSLRENLPKNEKSSNLSLAGRLNLLMFTTIILFFIIFLVNILVISAREAILASKDILKDSKLNSKNKPPILHQKLILGSMTNFIQDFKTLLKKDRNRKRINQNIAKLNLIEDFENMSVLRDEKEELVKKVDTNIQRSSFGGLFRLQHDKLTEIVNTAQKTSYNTLCWLLVFGFIHQFLSLLLLV